MASPRRRPSPIAAIALALLALLTYLRVICTGGFIWDDPQHVTENPVLRTLGGLANLWLHPQSIPQYYPLVHTTFWIEFHLWGLHPLGYHLDNVLLHTLASVLLWRVLARLQVRGAWLAAALFAVHPVQVESVAWITERKNVLSAVLYFLSAHAYLSFAGDDFSSETPKLAPYLLSLLCFVAALLSKSVTCSLPAAILLLVYWRRGNLRWRDVWPVLPMFALGAGMAFVTGYLERSHVGAAGAAWHFSAAQRCVIAGRAIWFYLYTLLWPAHLMFVYPKWDVAHLLDRVWLFGFPLSVLLALASLWLLRRKIGRGPLVAALFFCGTLVPGLGFVNVYPMRYTFVADHYQYLACIGIFAIAAGAVLRIPGGRVLAAIILAALVFLSWRQQAIYRDAYWLWSATVQQNPTSFLAWANEGDALTARSNDTAYPAARRATLHRQAIDAYERLLRLAPDAQGVSAAHLNLGLIKLNDGDLGGAEKEFNAALAADPSSAAAWNAMGKLRQRQGQVRESIGLYRRALAIQPHFAEAHFNLGTALEDQRQPGAAIDQYEQALSERGGYDAAEYALANALLFLQHRPDLAEPHYAAAAAEQPQRADYRTYYAIDLRELGQLMAARRQCGLALQLDPGYAPARQLWEMLRRSR